MNHSCASVYSWVSDVKVLLGVMKSLEKQIQCKKVVLKHCPISCIHFVLKVHTTVNGGLGLILFSLCGFRYLLHLETDSETGLLRTVNAAFIA